MRIKFRMHVKMINNKRGFTLIELLVAMVVTGIILSAISTLAFAMSSANKSFGDVSRTQAQVRFTTLKIQEMIRNCNLICSSSQNDIAIWLSDDNNDKFINISELAYIEFGSERDHLCIYTFDSSSNSAIDIDSIGSYSNNWWSAYSGNVKSVMLLPECSNIEFYFDELPPNSRFLNIKFEITENDIARQYQIVSTLRCNNMNIVSSSNEIISDDD